MRGRLNYFTVIIGHGREITKRKNSVRLVQVQFGIVPGWVSESEDIGVVVDNGTGRITMAGAKKDLEAISKTVCLRCREGELSDDEMRQDIAGDIKGKVYCEKLVLVRRMCPFRR